MAMAAGKPPCSPTWMEAEAVVRLAAREGRLEERRHACVGQGHEVGVPPGALTTADGKKLRAAFETEYERQYHRTVPGLVVECSPSRIDGLTERQLHGPTHLAATDLSCHRGAEGANVIAHLGL
jgi:hypothetical protein